MKRRRGVVGLGVLLGLAVLGPVGGCGGAPRCGMGRYAQARRSNTPRASAPYCMLLATEGVGRLNIGVNRDPLDEEEGGGTDRPDTSGPRTGPFTYTLSTPRGVAFLDVCGQPGAQRVLATVDDQNAPVTIYGLFPVRVWDAVVAPPFTVSSNGWMSFTAGANGALSGQVPSPAPPNLTVAPYWNDLHTRATGICYGMMGSAPARRLVIQWQDLHFCCYDDPAVHLTFEVVVHEARPGANNIIDVVYQQMNGAEQRQSGAGIENSDGSSGVAIQPPWSAPRAVRYTPSR